MNKALPAALRTALTAAFVLFAILAEPAYAGVLLTDQVLGTSAQERGWKSFVHVFLLSGELNAVYASCRWDIISRHVVPRFLRLWSKT